MNGLFIGLLIALGLLFLALIGYIFYKIFDEFGAKEVIMTLIITAVLIGAIIFTSFITIKAGEINCEYSPAVKQLNFTTGKNYTISPAFSKCSFEFLGTKTPSKNFEINN